MKDEYYTIEKPSSGLYKDKGSKFYAFAYPIFTEKEISNIIKEIKAEHHTARHHCYAYKINPENAQFKYNDDGEPSGSAGRPILGQILSNDLTNILIVVVRYFGGTKLGIRGLINAYKGAAKDAIENSKIEKKQILTKLKLEFDYPAINKIMYLLKKENIQIIQTKFGLSCSVDIEVRKNKTKMIHELLKKNAYLKISYL